MTLTSNDILTAVSTTAFLQTGLDVLEVNNVEEDGRVFVFTAKIRGELVLVLVLVSDCVLLVSGAKIQIIVNTNIVDFHHQQQLSSHQGFLSTLIMYIGTD